MELGEKILQVRKEAGLSQRQLCGEVITRNMLSQIEHGAAKPSMDTLKHLASRLGKPVSYFLEEDLDTATLEAIGKLRQAQNALAEGKHRYAAQLLERLETDLPELQRTKQLLLAQIPGAELETIVAALPDLDEELLLRAKVAFSKGNTDRCLHLMESMENRDTSQWYLLRGRVCIAQNQPQNAVEYLLRAEGSNEVYGLLEGCYRDMEDYRQAYLYAVKQK